MSSEDTFKPYGSIISCALTEIINNNICEFNNNICDIIVSFLSVPISVIIEHDSENTMVTLTSLTCQHNILYKFPSIIGNKKEDIVGYDAINTLSSVSLLHPMRNGIISKYSLLQIDKIWNYIFNNLLLLKPPNIKISSHSVLLILPPQTMYNISICDKIIQFLFEIYNVPALALMDKASLSCHYYCYSQSINYHKKNGLVIDLGHDIITITPVFDFKSDLNKMYTTKLFAATSLQQYISNILKQQQFPSEISCGMKEIDNILKNYVKIAESRTKYQYILSQSFYDGVEYITTNQKLHCWIENWILYDIGEYIFNPFKYNISYPHYIDVNNWIKPKDPLKLKRFTINEMDKYSYLQNKKNDDTSNIKGLPQLIYDLVMEYDDIKLRQSLLNNIILTGSMSYIHGLQTRLKQEMIEILEEKSDIDIDIDIDIVCGDRRDECNSICASILTSMPSMANIWLTKNEYFESIQQVENDILYIQ